MYIYGILLLFFRGFCTVYRDLTWLQMWKLLTTTLEEWHEWKLVSVIKWRHCKTHFSESFQFNQGVVHGNFVNKKNWGRKIGKII